MAYTTPVTDRTMADVQNKTAKGYFNLADFTRIYGNNVEVNTLLAIFGASVPSFTTISGVTTASTDLLAIINTMVGNIENLRLWCIAIQPSYFSGLTGFDELKDDWAGGPSASAPTYVYVNSWEKVLDLAYQKILDYTADRSPCIGIAVTGSDFTYQNRWR